MTSPVRERLTSLRRRLRVTSLMFGVGLLVVVLGTGALLAGFLDWAVHVDDAGLRLLAGVSILLAGLWVAAWWIVRPLRRTATDDQLALEVERRNPGLRDRFASSLSFLAGNCDPAVGSPALQRRAIAEAERRVGGVNVDSVVPMRPARIAAGSAIGVCVLATLVMVLWPAQSGTALERLMFPLSAGPWPRETQLAFVDETAAPVPLDHRHPLRRARGATLELYVVNELGELPATAEIETRVGKGRDADVTSSRLRRVVLRADDGGTTEVFKLSLPIERGPLAFRVVGGDDRDAPFQPIEVLPPPTIASLRVTLTPPAYTGEPRTTLPEGVGHVTGLVGTRVDVVATTSKPVRHAKLHVRDRAEDVELADDGRTFESSFVIHDPGVHSYWFRLVDAEEIENARPTRYEIRGREDSVPTVTIEEPATDLRVTAVAVVPLRIVAKDDLGLVRVERVWRLERTGDPNIPPERDLLWADERTERAEIERLWNLGDLRLDPGDRILLTAEAFDAFVESPAGTASDADDTDDSAPPARHVGRSLGRTLLIVSAAEKRREIAAAAGTLEDELDRAADGFRSARDRTGELLVQSRTVGRLRDADIDVLKGVELDQRRSIDRLVAEGDGVLPRAEELLRSLERNGLADPETRRNLESIVDELRFLKDRELGDVASNLTTARKAAADGTAGEAPFLELAREGQSRVVDTLDELVAGLSKSRSRRELENDVEALVEGQRELRDRTAALLGRTLGRDPGDLPEQDRAELAKIGGRQRTRAEEVERLHRRLEAAANALRDSNPEAADMVADAAAALRERGAAEAMESAADAVERNDVGRATAAQDRALEALEDVRSALDNRAVTDTETLVDRLRETEDELETLRDEQAEVLRKTREANDEPDDELRLEKLEKLTEQREELKRRTERAARRLGRLRARSAAGAARRAVDRMDDVERLLRERDEDRAEQFDREVLDELDQAVTDTATARRRAEERLARELLENVGDELGGIIARQRSIVAEVERLRDEIAQNGRLKRSQAATLRNLAEVQRALGAEVATIAEQLAAAEVFALTLRRAAEEMANVAGRLADRKVDEHTLAVANEVVERLESLVAALDDGDEPTPPPDAGPNGGGSETPQGDDGPPELVSIVAQLRLLKSMQQRLLDRTKRLDGIRDEGTLTDAEIERELESIADEQERIADLARSLVDRLTGPAGDANEVEPTEDESPPGGTSDE